MINATTQQKYYGGKPGEYLCECVTCKSQFFGDMRDSVCPSCERNAALEITRKNLKLATANTALALDNARLRDCLRRIYDPSTSVLALDNQRPALREMCEDIAETLSQSPVQSMEVLD